MITFTLTGRKLDEYLIDTPLGAGGMAHVYRAIDTRLRRYVALKVMIGNVNPESDYARRFEREAQSIACLEHHNIVHVSRFGLTDGLCYIAMSYSQLAQIICLSPQLWRFKPSTNVGK